MAGASVESLREALEAVRARRETVAVLHLLCHGARLAGAGGGFGLALNAAAGVEAAVLAPYAGLVGCVVLAACEGDTLGRAAHERMGRLTGALSQRLDVLWDELPARQKRQGRRLLVELVVPADDVTLSTRRRGEVDKLRPGGAEAGRAFDAVLETLVAQRLLVRGQPERKEGGDVPAGGGWVEIAHEALIRKWPRLQGWLKEEKQRAYRRKVRVAYALTAGAVLVLLVMAGLAFVAYNGGPDERGAAAGPVGQLRADGDARRQGHGGEEVDCPGVAVAKKHRRSRL